MNRFGRSADSLLRATFAFDEDTPLYETQAKMRIGVRFYCPWTADADRERRVSCTFVWCPPALGIGSCTCGRGALLFVPRSAKCMFYFLLIHSA